MKYVFLLVVALVLVSCSVFSNDDDTQEVGLNTAKIESVRFESGQAIFELIVLNTGCYTIANPANRTLNVTGEGTLVTVLGNPPELPNCATVIVRAPRSVKIPVQAGATTTFKFQNWNGSVDTTITIPSFN